MEGYGAYIPGFAEFGAATINISVVLSPLNFASAMTAKAVMACANFSGDRSDEMRVKWSLFLAAEHLMCVWCYGPPAGQYTWEPRLFQAPCSTTPIESLVLGMQSYLQCSTSTFHGTCPNANFEEIQTSNTHKSIMITEYLPVRSFILPIWDGWAGG